MHIKRLEEIVYLVLQLKGLEIEVNSNIVSIWIPVNIAVLDETLVLHKGCQHSHHHIFIMRNPHPHGIKNWSLVDYSGYLYQFLMDQCDWSGEKKTHEPTHETIM